jgi:hypothetical protein
LDPTTPRQLGRTGLALSQLGMGTAPLGNLWERITESRAEATLAAAWAGGVAAHERSPLREQRGHVVGYQMVVDDESAKGQTGLRQAALSRVSVVLDASPWRTRVATTPRES